MSKEFTDLQEIGVLEIVPGRVAAYRPRGWLVEATLALRGGGTHEFKARHIINGIHKIAIRRPQNCEMANRRFPMRSVWVWRLAMVRSSTAPARPRLGYSRSGR